MNGVLIDNELFSINLSLRCPASTLQYCALKRAFTLGELADLMWKGVEGLDEYYVDYGSLYGRVNLLTKYNGKTYFNGELYNDRMQVVINRIHVRTGGCVAFIATI